MTRQGAEALRRNEPCTAKTCVHARVQSSRFKVQGLFLFLSFLLATALADSPDVSFVAGTQAYKSGDYSRAADSDLFLITVAGIILFLTMVGLSKLALGTWHDSVAESEA